MRERVCERERRDKNGETSGRDEGGKWGRMRVRSGEG